MRKQKIIKVGNSLAVTLPASFVKEGKLKVGDELIIETAPQYQTALIKSAKSPVRSSLTPEFFEWLNTFVKENDDLLKTLARMP